MKHSNMHVRSSFFSQTETKSLNQKATATNFLFLLFKIPFLELRRSPSLRIRKSFDQCHFFSFQNAYIFKCKLFHFIITIQLLLLPKGDHVLEYENIVTQFFFIYLSLKYAPLKQSSIHVKHKNIHVRSSFFSQMETKSLNQKITATHFPFLFFKILFFQTETNSHINKTTANQLYHVLSFQK